MSEIMRVNGQVHQSIHVANIQALMAVTKPEDAGVVDEDEDAAAGDAIEVSLNVENPKKASRNKQIADLPREDS